MTTLLLFYLSYISAPEQHYEYLVAIALPIAQQNQGSLFFFFENQEFKDNPMPLANSEVR